MNVSVEQIVSTGRRLGKGPASGSPKDLLFKNFLKTPMKVPEATNYWTKKAKFPLRSFGNTQYGDCTRASQALLAMRMERIECKRTPTITDEEVIRVYTEMSDRLYGGGDNGALETDALNCWRNKDYTFRDTKGRPLTIDAYTRINYSDVEEVKRALCMANAHGIKACFNLPEAFETTTDLWDLPEGQNTVGAYAPGSWGGHSMTAVDYDKVGVRLVHSWGVPDGKITWRAFLAYCDEAYLVIDSVDAWKKRVGKNLNIPALISAVNEVSDTKIKK